MTSTASSPTIPPTQRPDTKVLSDLSTVIEKINLCTSMLATITSTSQIDQDESLLTIIGFLESCLPRVRELIEAGMTGGLAEDTLTKCLMVNDSLCQVLEFVEHPEQCQGVTATANSDDDDDDDEDDDGDDAKASSPVNDFDAFGIDDDDDADDDLFRINEDSIGGDGQSKTTFSEKKPAAVSVAENDSVKAATTTLDDLLLAPTPAAPPPTTPVIEGVAPVAVVPEIKDEVDEMDEFDDFFNDRVSKE
jgi:hypothetical protein